MTGRARRVRGVRSAPLWVALAVGVGLVLAPVVFGMFTRAPAGGAMLADFRPFMDEEVLAGFADDLELIDAAHAETAHWVATAVADGTAVDTYPATAAMGERWPAIRDDMTAMLADIGANIDNYAAVAALPPFALFPWFFVLPGLAVAALAGAALRAVARGRDHRRLVTALAVVAIATAAAPVAFAMFDRAPAGGAMIDDLRPLMTAENVAAVQDHFLTIGAFEGELRNTLLPELETAGHDPAATTPTALAFTASWPRIAGEMAPMIGAMSDNLDAFAGIDALPPFALFPWFFVLPGAIVVGAALWTRTVPPRARPVRTSPDRRSVP